MKVKLSMIDKDLRNMGRIIKLFNNSFSDTRFKLMYKLSRKYRIKLKDEKMQLTEAWLPRKDGSKIRLCIFKPLKPVKDVAGILWLHGGGYAIGTPEQVKLYAEKFIEARTCIIVAPDYRLSMEEPYPLLCCTYMDEK